MRSPEKTIINHNDQIILRELAKKVKEISALPIQETRIKRWAAHNKLQSGKPMILIYPEGSWRELLPESNLSCSTDLGRKYESDLRRRIYYYEHFLDDSVIEDEIRVEKVVESSGWGLAPERNPSSREYGAWAFKPVLKDYGDLEKIKTPKISYNEELSQKILERVQEVFEDLLPVRLTGITHISYHLMAQYTDLRGLEQMMIDMFENPDFLHKAMNIITDGHKQILRQYQKLKLLTLNNDNTYHSTGGVGYTDELPAEGFDPSNVRPEDMWSSAEAQELAQVGPGQHREFALYYEKQLLSQFGLNGYGCCEPLTDRLDMVFEIPMIRRISISPFADVKVAAEKLQNNYVYSWKPSPTDLVGSFNEESIRTYLRKTLELAKKNNCILEMILKDTHTCENRIERFDIWSQIARKEVERLYS